jgi:hypothetical protein
MAILTIVKTILVWSRVTVAGHLAGESEMIVASTLDATHSSGLAVLGLVTPKVTGSASVSYSFGVPSHHHRNLPGGWWLHSESGGVSHVGGSSEAFRKDAGDVLGSGDVGDGNQAVKHQIADEMITSIDMLT